MGMRDFIFTLYPVGMFSRASQYKTKMTAASASIINTATKKAFDRNNGIERIFRRLQLGLCSNKGFSIIRVAHNGGEQVFAVFICESLGHAATNRRHQ